MNKLEQAAQQAVKALESKIGETHPFAHEIEKATAIRVLREALDHSADTGKMVCNWYQDDGDGIWATDCGGVFEIIEGSPSDNDMKFCPYCGKSLEEHPFVDLEDEQ